MYTIIDNERDRTLSLHQEFGSTGAPKNTPLWAEKSGPLGYFLSQRPDLPEDALVQVTDSDGNSYTDVVRDLSERTMEAILQGLPQGASAERIYANP